jgi:hypothetical protein
VSTDRLLTTIRSSYYLQIYSLRGTRFWLISSVPSNKPRGLLDHLVDISRFSETSATICRPIKASYPGRLESSSTHLWETEISHRIIVHSYFTWGARWRSWLRYYAINRQVAGSIPHGVIGIFQWHNPSGRTMALGSTQPLTEMSTTCITWGKGGLCVRLTTLPPSCAVVMKSGNLNFLEPSGPFQACNGTTLTLPYFRWRNIQLYQLLHLGQELYGLNLSIKLRRATSFLKMFSVSFEF